MPKIVWRALLIFNVTLSTPAAPYKLYAHVFLICGPQIYQYISLRTICERKHCHWNLKASIVSLIIYFIPVRLHLAYIGDLSARHSERCWMLPLPAERSWAVGRRARDPPKNSSVQYIMQNPVMYTAILIRCHNRITTRISRSPATTELRDVLVQNQYS